MGFLDSLFRRSSAPALPGLEALLAGEGLEGVPEGLEAHLEEFDHLHDLETRQAFARAAAALLRSGQAFPPVFEDLHGRLFPEVVAAWRADREPFWRRRFLEGMAMRLTVDGAPIRSEWLALWGRGEEEVVDQALEALRPGLDRAWDRLPSGIYRSPWHDGRDAARLLLSDSYAAPFADQTTFLAAPHGGVVYAAPQPLLPRLMEAVQAELGKAPLVMGALLQRIDDKLVPARLQDPHPMAASQRELKQLDQLEAMKAQGEDLDPALGLPAQAGLIRTKDRTFTIATWPEQDQAVLLPEVDLLLMVDRQGQPLGLFSRSSLPRIARLKAEPVAIWGPRRSRIEGFPTAEELARLDCAANAEQTLAFFGAKAPAPPKKDLLNTQPLPSLPQHLRGQVGKQD